LEKKMQMNSEFGIRKWEINEFGVRRELFADFGLSNAGYINFA
jgi:hypothetical protein